MIEDEKNEKGKKEHVTRRRDDNIVIMPPLRHGFINPVMKYLIHNNYSKILIYNLFD